MRFDRRDIVDEESHGRELLREQRQRNHVLLVSEAKFPHVSAVAVTPGFLRSEYLLDQFGVTEENGREAASKVGRFSASETPYFLGRAMVALAADPKVHAQSGKVFGSWTLAKEYRFTDRNGTRPDWGKAFREGR